MKKIILLTTMIVLLISSLSISVFAFDAPYTNLPSVAVDDIRAVPGIMSDFYEEHVLSDYLYMRWGGISSYFVEPAVLDCYNNSTVIWEFWTSDIPIEQRLPLALTVDGHFSKMNNITYFTDVMTFIMSRTEDGYSVNVFAGTEKVKICDFIYRKIENIASVDGYVFVLDSVNFYAYNPDHGSYGEVTDYIHDISNLTVTFWFTARDVTFSRAFSDDLRSSNLRLFSRSIAKDVVLGSEQYNAGYGDGKSSGYDLGYQEGYDTAFDYATAFDKVTEFVKALFEAPFRLVVSFLDIEIFGINLMWVLCALIFVAVICLVVPLVTKFL